RSRTSGNKCTTFFLSCPTSIRGSNPFGIPFTAFQQSQVSFGERKWCIYFHWFGFVCPTSLCQLICSLVSGYANVCFDPGDFDPHLQLPKLHKNVLDFEHEWSITVAV